MIITNINTLQVFDAILRTDNTYAASELTISLLQEGMDIATDFTPTGLVYSNNSVEVSFTIVDGFFSVEQSYLLTIKDSNDKLLFRDKLQVRGLAIDEVIENDRYALEESDFIFIQDDNASNSFATISESMSGDKHYTHDQGVVSSIWTINHNLAKYPSVSVVDTSNAIVVGVVEYIDTNNLTITFNASFSGSAYIN